MATVKQKQASKMNLIKARAAKKRRLSPLARAFKAEWNAAEAPVRSALRARGAGKKHSFSGLSKASVGRIYDRIAQGVSKKRASPSLRFTARQAALKVSLSRRR